MLWSICVMEYHATPKITRKSSRFIVKEHFLSIMYGMIPLLKLCVNKGSTEEYVAEKRDLEASPGDE